MNGARANDAAIAPMTREETRRALGADTAEVLGSLLGMKPDVLRDLSEAGVI